MRRSVQLVLPDFLAGLDEGTVADEGGQYRVALYDGVLRASTARPESTCHQPIPQGLTSVLTNSHAQVGQAADESLKQFCEVISPGGDPDACAAVLESYGGSW